MLRSWIAASIYKVILLDLHMWKMKIMHEWHARRQATMTVDHSYASIGTKLTLILPCRKRLWLTVHDLVLNDIQRTM